MSKEILRENVPRIRTRQGDVVVAAPNNSMLLLGRDRAGSVDTGYGDEPGSAAATLVVGRSGQDPSFSEDATTLFLSARSDPDDYAGTDSGPPQKGKPSALIVTDCVRIRARTDLKIVVGKASFHLSPDGSIVVEGEVSIGRGAFERAIKGDSFFVQYIAHTHPVAPTPAGLVAGPMTPPPSPEAFLTRRLRFT